MNLSRLGKIPEEPRISTIKVIILTEDTISDLKIFNKVKELLIMKNFLIKGMQLNKIIKYIYIYRHTSKIFPLL